MPELTLGTNQCQCGECNEYFASVGTFDKHRIFTSKQAKYSQDWDSRRCMTVKEMKAKGWVKNAKGFWITGRMPTFLRTK